MNAVINTLDEKFHTLTDKYKLAKTSDIVDQIVGLGFNLDSFVAMKVRKKERQGFQKHRAIFSSPSLKATVDGAPQLLLTNSHDGTSSVILQLGFFRYVCANGLVVGENICPPIKIRHSGENFSIRLIEAINLVIANAERLAGEIERLKGFTLTGSAIAKFQREAIEYRTGAKVESFQMNVNRPEDAGLDVFTILNVVQENLIRGGAYAVLDRDGKKSSRRLKRLTSIKAQNDLNVKLWNMAEELMQGAA